MPPCPCSLSLAVLTKNRAQSRVPQHVLCVVECKRYCRQRRLNKRMQRSNENIEEGPAMTFKNDII